MTADKVVKCQTHGFQPKTFVCGHIANSLITRQPVGFWWPEDSAQQYPDAWCSDCNERHRQCGYEWVGEAEQYLDAKLLCAGCYVEARRLCLGE